MYSVLPTRCRSSPTVADRGLWSSVRFFLLLFSDCCVAFHICGGVQLWDGRCHRAFRLCVLDFCVSLPPSRTINIVQSMHYVRFSTENLQKSICPGTYAVFFFFSLSVWSCFFTSRFLSCESLMFFRNGLMPSGKLTCSLGFLLLQIFPLRFSFFSTSLGIGFGVWE